MFNNFYKLNPFDLKGFLHYIKIVFDMFHNAWELKYVGMRYEESCQGGLTPVLLEKAGKRSLGRGANARFVEKNPGKGR